MDLEAAAVRLRGCQQLGIPLVLLTRKGDGRAASAFVYDEVGTT